MLKIKGKPEIQEVIERVNDSLRGHDGATTYDFHKYAALLEKRFSEYRIMLDNPKEIDKINVEEFLRECFDPNYCSLKEYYVQSKQFHKLLMKPKRKERIIALLAKHYKCKKSEIYIGDIDFKDTDDTVVPYKIIVGDVIIGPDSKVESLGNLEHIIGSATICTPRITSLDNLETVEGELICSGENLTSFGELKRIGWNAFCNGLTINTPWKLEEVDGEAQFEGLRIDTLEPLKAIKGRNAVFTDAEIGCFGDVSIPGNLILNGAYINIFETSEVGGGLYCEGTEISNLYKVSGKKLTKDDIEDYKSRTNGPRVKTYCKPEVFSIKRLSESLLTSKGSFARKESEKDGEITQ